MNEEKDIEQNESSVSNESANESEEANAKADESAEANAKAEEKTEAKDEVNPLEKELADMKDKYLRLYSEFDNYKRRTDKEKIDLRATATESLMLDLLPVLDDFQRAAQSFDEATEVKAIKEGVDLIRDKFFKTLANKGLKPIEAKGQPFDAELHEGISQMPVDSKKMKGKVIEEVEKGYYLGEKVIRYSKVVIGA